MATGRESQRRGSVSTAQAAATESPRLRHKAGGRPKVTAAPARRRPVVAEDQIVIGNFAEAPLDWIAIRLFCKLHPGNLQLPLFYRMSPKRLQLPLFGSRFIVLRHPVKFRRVNRSNRALWWKQITQRQQEATTHPKSEENHQQQIDGIRAPMQFSMACFMPFMGTDKRNKHSTENATRRRRRHGSTATPLSWTGTPAHSSPMTQKAFQPFCLFYHTQYHMVCQKRRPLCSQFASGNYKMVVTQKKKKPW
ncbi:hypothetical protein PVAP13_1NG508619 [Panicum virgatum]|uniref:Uncharacterized protein n=1 Tax=Panicum virgatum TaxID=38727 RepID=A0A8T0X9S5_PANVG|nr:hypothetical protein PVAP13_1NG508619 [Panicum virgatum]